MSEFFPASPRIRDSRQGVLAVDDDHGFLRTLRNALRPQYRFWSAPSAEQAQRVLQRVRRIDGVLLDVRLPGTSGIEFCRHLRSTWPGLKVFLMSGCDLADVARQGAHARASAFLSKPFSLETLRLMLASHLGSGRAE